MLEIIGNPNFRDLSALLNGIAAVVAASQNYSELLLFNVACGIIMLRYPENDNQIIKPIVKEYKNGN